MKSTIGRRCMAAALVLALAGMAAPPARAQAAPASGRWAVLSLVGDKFDIVVRRAGVGSNLDRNVHEGVAIEGQALDRSAAQAMEAALAAHGLSDRVLLLTHDERLYAAQESLPGADGPSGEPAQRLRGLLQQARATHLLLLTRHRADASFDSPDGWIGRIGRGRISGLGFYIDHVQALRDDRTGRVIEGYFAPFASVSLRLIEASSLKVVAEASAKVSRTVAAASSDSAMTAVMAWDAMSMGDKLAELDALLRTAATQATDQVLDKR